MKAEGEEMESPPPAKQRVTVVATERGFDGASVIEAGQKLTLELSEGESIPSWTTLVTE